MEGRFALIGACSSFHPDAMAGEQTRTMPGRPGINGIRCSTVYQVPKEDLEHLKRIADAIGINGSRNIIRKEGYLPPLPDNKAEFGEMIFEAAEQPGKTSRVNPVDMARMEKSIKEARYFADYVIVSIHSHQLKSTDKTQPDDFLEEFCRKCIDAGAHAVIGTGPHGAARCSIAGGWESASQPRTSARSSARRAGSVVQVAP